MEHAMNSVPPTIAIPGYLAGTWKADPAHSEIAFSIRQLAGKVRGRFTGYDVTIVTTEDPLGSSVTATIDLTSIDTGNKRRDKHLRHADYFKAKTNPTMSYRSTGINRTDDGWLLDGELTLCGVSREVPLTVDVTGFGPDPAGGQLARFSATAQLSRRDFGLHITMQAGGIVIADQLSINLQIQALLQK
jgi:polyisoprenoid-binding protein YceI